MPRSTIFTVGGTVQASGGRYIARAVDTELLQNCRNGDFSFVLTARQMGKSSLMVRTAEQLSEEGIRSTIVDLSQIGVQVTEDSWYLGILTRIEDALDLETDVYEWWDTHQQLGHGQRLTAFFEEIVLKEISSSLVVFMDEIDSTLSLPFTDDFFAAIRYIYNARASNPDFQRLSFVLIGVATPNDLITDPSRTPFNIGKQVDIQYFTRDEARPLAEGFGLDDEAGQRLLGWILKWTNGHPFLTQRLSAAIAETDDLTVTEADVDKLVASTFFGDQSEHDSNLRFVHDMLTRRAEDPSTVLTTFRQIIKGKKVQDDRQSDSITHLKLSGIVGRQNGQLQVRNNIYAEVFDKEWLAQQWPEHWLRRVPPAVIGLVAASFFAVILLGVLFFQLQRTSQAVETASIQTELSDSLQIQFDVTASLNQRLSEQNNTLDSLRLETESANSSLSDQFLVADSLRSVEAFANVRLSDQIAIAESLRVQALTANQGLQFQVYVSDSLASEVQSQLNAASAARLETLTLALANTSRRQTRLGNGVLGALLARQAYHFSLQGEGSYLDTIYDALTSSLNSVSSSDQILAGGPNLIGSFTAAIRSMAALDADGNVAAGLEDGAIVLLSPNGESYQLNSSIGSHSAAIRMITAVPATGQIVSAGDDGRVLVWTPRGDGSYDDATLTRYDGSALAVSASSDGQLLATASSTGDVDLWQLSTGQLLYDRNYGEAGSVRTLALNPLDNSLAIGADDGRIRLLSSAGDPLDEWDAEQGRIRSLAFHPTNNSLVSGGDLPTVHYWTFSTGSSGTLVSIALQGHEGPVNSLAISNDGTYLASGSYDHSIQLWELSQLQANSIILQDHDHWVESVLFVPGANQLISGSADRSVNLWNLEFENLAEKVCSQVDSIELSSGQWDQYVGSDFSYTNDYTPCSRVSQADTNDD